MKTDSRRLTDWLSSFATRKGGRLGPIAEFDPDEALFVRIEDADGGWSRACFYAPCAPALVTALSRELATTVVSISEFEEIGLESFCALERGEIKTIYALLDEVADQEGFDVTPWVERFLASGRFKVPRGITPGDYPGYVFGACCYASEVNMDWVIDWVSRTPNRR